MSPAVPEQLNPPASVLFLGSGFTRDAINIRDENVPIGEQLKARFADLLDVPASAYDLKVLAEELASQPDSSLYALLHQLFTIQRLSVDQLEILRQPRLRIYTTNYDDAAEFGQYTHF